MNTSSDFYAKLRRGEDVAILIVGDSIGEGAGGTPENHWFRQLKDALENHFQGKVHLTNVSMGGNTSYAGYARTMALDDGIVYDLAILCYGQNDKREDFDLYYETILQALIRRYPSCRMIAILESSQREYTEKIQIIQQIASAYHIPTADTIKAFRDSGIDYRVLAKDNVHPCAHGQDLYYQTVLDVLLAQLDQPALPYPDKPLRAEAEQYFPAVYRGAEHFRRVDARTYEAVCAVNDAVLGIDYTYQSGENHTEIEIDGVPAVTVDTTFNYPFTQRHLLIAAKHISVHSTIRVRLMHEAAADGFLGLVFSGSKEHQA